MFYADFEYSSLCTVCLCLSINRNQILFRKIKKKCYHSSSNDDHWFYIYLSYHLQLFDILTSKAFHTLNRLFTHSTDRSINQIWSTWLYFSVFFLFHPYTFDWVHRTCILPKGHHPDKIHPRNSLQYFDSTTL